MRKELQQAIIWRKEGKLKESNTLLLQIVSQHPNDAFIQYHCAWSFDVLGEESKAVPYYEKAIELGLPENEMEGALLGLGSTYRVLGDYEKSKKVFLHAIKLFPENNALQVFYAMTLYNLKEHDTAMELLLKCLSHTTNDKEILSYQKAIDFYADKLDEIWT
ncbi:tetratricopeptide repeat protein [Psychrobacillus vulpis]|uniref:Tetratricopeptide repeat protein n=1 Tax=Psychrobacillus vulpis TaxID=2325572 RepID=A0A544TT32_9BACI|nr:tetratricopeptide repeat protein [Psychrobacillus vulpis]TQR20616.1 tetratricopeptide repeat protein [Psychrobacillus vulpis]